VQDSAIGKPMLEARNLSVHYRDRGTGPWSRSRGIQIAVDRLTLSISSGETMALVGRSGCGKTSLMMALLRLVKPLKGEILFRKQNLWQMGGEGLSRFRHSVQPVFQNFQASLNPQLKIATSIADGLSKRLSRHQRRERIAELLQAVDLGDRFGELYPHQLSGGQKQRVNIARALAVQPDLLLLDEPFSAQDLSIQISLMRLLLRIRKEQGVNYLLISHDLGLVRFMVDQVAVMQAGRIVEKGVTSQILQNPVTKATRELVQQSGLS